MRSCRAAARRFQFVFSSATAIAFRSASPLMLRISVFREPASIRVTFSASAAIGTPKTCFDNSGFGCPSSKVKEPSPITRYRLTKFSNSRRFPGQEYR